MEQNTPTTPRSNKSVDIPSENQFNKCPICLEHIENETKFAELNTCKHTVCEPCFKSLISYSDKCPLCAKNFLSCKLKSSIVENNTEYHLNSGDLEKIKGHKNSFSQGNKNFK